MGIVEFLNARLDDDEAYARMAFAEHNDATPEWSEPWSGSVLTGPREDPILTFDSGISRHMVRHDPARVLREAAAKRSLVTMYAKVADMDDGTDVWAFSGAHGQANGLGIAVRALASVYADHPDYEEAWKP